MPQLVDRQVNSQSLVTFLADRESTFGEMIVTYPAVLGGHTLGEKT